MTKDVNHNGRSSVSRRRLLFGGAAVGGGAALALVADRTGVLPLDKEPSLDTQGLAGKRAIAFHGTHQAGIATPVMAHASYVALDLHDSTDAEALGRMMRLLTDDSRRLMSGRGALADTEPELAEVPANLTVTFGFGEELVRRAGGADAVPRWLRPLPDFSIDALEERWSGGDLLIIASADDPVTVAHAVRMLLKDARAFASLRWRQDGFRRAYGSEPSGTTMRNLFGQIDGTTNPKPGTSEFDTTVWSKDGWLTGGTGFVLRRIKLHLDTWDEVDPVARSFSVGRRFHDGAPLTGSHAHDKPDFDAKNERGMTIISPVAHIARARPHQAHEVIFRRSYNYDIAPEGNSVSESGMLFASFQADVERQFVPIQQRLAEADLLNTWTTPVGSAVFAIPPGCAEGGFIGDTLIS